ncbi:HESO1 [Scenedesmus sp. PABB004]|nr:HESO1 [Scenedesmus sp. PABB004]
MEPAAPDPDRLALFDDALDALLDALQPTPESDAVRRGVVAEMADLVAEVLPAHLHPGLEAFGSFRAGLHLPGSDLDFAVTGWVPAAPPQGPDEPPPPPLELHEWSPHEQCCLLEDLADALEARGLVDGQVERILHARVPVLKAVHARTRLACDFSISRPECAFKAEMQKLLGSLDRRYAELYRLVKTWAAAHGLNDAASGTLNSWSLGLLVAFYLQCGETPALLPPVWELLERQAPSMRAPRVLQRPGVTCAALKRLLDLATIGAGAYLGKRARLSAGGENPKTLAELLLGFFGFCGAQMAAWTAGQEGTRASAWWGRWVSAPWGAKRYIFSIEDPFNAVDNTARSVGTHNSLANATTAGYIAWVTSSSEARMRAALDATSGGDAASDVLAAYAWLFGPSAVLRLPRLPAPLAGALAAAVPDEDARESHAAADAALGGATAALSLSSCLVNATNNGSSSDPAKVQRVQDALELFRRLVASLGDGGSWPVCLGDYTARQRERAAAARRRLEEQAADGGAAGLAAAVGELHVGSAPARPAAWPPHRQQQQVARAPRPAQARRQPHQQQLGGGGDGGARGRSRSSGGGAAHRHDAQARAAAVVAALSALPNHPPGGSAPRAVPAGRGRAGRHSSSGGGGADLGASLFSSSAPLPPRPRRGQAAAAAGDGGAQPADAGAAPQRHHGGAVQAGVAGSGGGPLLSAALKDALHAANGGSAGGDGGGRRPRYRAVRHGGSEAGQRRHGGDAAPRQQQHVHAAEHH